MKQNSCNRSLRVGIWCAYHVTLDPSEGIGVFAHNLARGLASLPDGPSVVLAIRHGDEELVQETIAHGQGRIETVAHDNGPSRRPTRRFARWCHRKAAKLTRLVKRFPNRTKSLQRLEKACEDSTSRLAAWCERLASLDAYPIMQHCDVWLIPYVGLELKFPTPTVLTIHDLVPYHFPDVISSSALAALQQIVPRIASQSSVVACMSEFIRRNDLEGVLGLPDEKIRVVKPAIPEDFGMASARNGYCQNFPWLLQPYFFYPAAFRTYKNHAILVRALDVLRRGGDNDTHIVFTGIYETPPTLRDLIASLSLGDRVHVLGKVDRSTLAQLYRHARATVVPSLYEQGSFPLIEALHWGCPIAGSRIPSLVEYFAPLGNAMRFFDPHCAEDVANVLLDLKHARETHAAAQSAGFQQIAQRTWTDAALDWLNVFKYAMQRHQMRECEKHLPSDEGRSAVDRHNRAT